MKTTFSKKIICFSFALMVGVALVSCDNFKPVAAEPEPISVSVYRVNFNPNTNMVVRSDSGAFDVIDVPSNEVSKMENIYYIGEKPSITAAVHSFTALEESTTGGTTETEGKLYEYSFDGNTWSLESDIATQQPFTGVITEPNSPDGTVHLYAYYTKKELSVVNISWKWEVVDGASFIDGSLPKADRVVSENAEMTEGLAYEDPNNRIIMSGTGREISGLPTDLTRYGYRHVGWSSSPTARTPRYNKATTINLQVDDGYITSTEERTITLYAVWQKDTRYWTYDDTSRVGVLLPGLYSTTNEKEENIPYYYEYGIPATGYVYPEVYDAEGDTPKVRKSTAFDHDFAIGEHMITGYMLSELNKFNTETQSGFELPTSAETTVPTSIGTVGYGSRMGASGATSPLGDSSHPLTYVSQNEAIIIANAMTAYYNEYTFDETLTYAYKTASGTPVKTRAEAASLIASSTRPLADITSTGWRLPTNAEWDYASRVIGESAYPFEVLYSSNIYGGSSYPQFENPEFVVGINRADKTEDAVSLYGWYANNSATTIEGVSYYTTRGFSSSTFIEGAGTPRSKYGSPIGIKGMQGNTAEWTDTFKEGSTTEVIVRGGSFTTPLESMYSGYIQTTVPSTKRYDIGVRLVRTV